MNISQRPLNCALKCPRSSLAELKIELQVAEYSNSSVSLAVCISRLLRY